MKVTRIFPELQDRVAWTRNDFRFAVIRKMDIGKSYWLKVSGEREHRYERMTFTETLTNFAVFVDKYGNNRTFTWSDVYNNAFFVRAS